MRACASLRSRMLAAHRCTVDDLSLGGARLHGAPPLRCGERVRLEVRIPGAPDLCLRGRVVRSHDSNGLGSLALRFRGIPPQAEDVIQELGLAAIERLRNSTVMVVHRSARERMRIARALCEHGCHVIAVATPLDMLTRLEDPWCRIGTAIVHYDLTQTSGAELLGFIASENPEIRRVALVPHDADPDIPEGLAHVVIRDAPDIAGRLEARLYGIGSPGQAHDTL
jgi:hypothetical protein